MEMGFTKVVEMLMEAKKPIIGHNMIYDVIYLYNQFIDDLPETYLEFIQKWFAAFPSVYDNKVLCSNAEYFGRTDLGKIYEKCTSDERLVNCGMKLAFDLKNGFVNYDGAGLLSHYHEAAYDAYMTAYSFAYCCKFKEFDQGNPRKNFVVGSNGSSLS
jgi:poly(A)-specific ribonuclease